MAADKKNKQMIVLDLEMNPVPKGSGSGLAREVIEIGAVRVCGKAITDSFRTYVRPSLSSTVSPYVRRLTGIRDGNLRNAPSFGEAVRELSDWIGMETETVICTWSDADRRQIMEESEAKTVEMPGNMSSYEDVQLMHHEKMGADITRTQMALHKAAEQYGIMMSRKESHSALYDARITAEILLVLIDSDKCRKQAEFLKRASWDSKETNDFGFCLGNLYRGIFERTDMQPARA